VKADGDILMTLFFAPSLFSLLSSLFSLLYLFSISSLSLLYLLSPSPFLIRIAFSIGRNIYTPNDDDDEGNGNDDKETERFPPSLKLFFCGSYKNL